MSLYESILRPVAFNFDPEWVHEQAMKMIQKGVLRARPFDDERLHQNFFGATFRNPLGLAAGFDKNGVALNYWGQMGFGFVEMGTVTYYAQPGNDRPRMFRLPEDQGLINRLGFNNQGAQKAAMRIGEATPTVPVGINLGKSKATPIESAALDYQESFRLLHKLGDYFVVNVSSPNTPGLRTLQDKAPLLEIFAALREVDSTRPMFVKVAPDLEWSAIDDVLEVALEANLTGIVATNTTISREGLSRDPAQAGGLSGRPVREKSNAVLKYIAEHCGKDLMLIGVGGIINAEDVLTKIKLGAHLCQVYTGWIYGGPHMLPDIMSDLIGIMDRDGVTHISEYRGALLR